MKKIYLLVTLDTECDKGPKWQVQQPLRFKNIIEGVPENLQPLFTEFGVKPTYLLSPEIMGDEGCVEVFQSIMGASELGTHLHSEFIEPEADFKANNTRSFQADFSPETEFKKLENLTGSFKKKFGFAPKSFRAGRFGLSRYTLEFLENLDYTVDSSVTPYKWWWRRRGEGVNFLGAPNQPYHPSRNDFRKPGNMKILEVPVTLINHFWEKFPLAWLRAINPINRLQTVALNKVIGRRLKCLWLRPTYSTAQEMMAVTEHLCRHVDHDRVVLCMMFHSNEAAAGLSPYNQTETDVARFLDRMKVYFEELFSKHQVRSLGLSEIADLF